MSYGRALADQELPEMRSLKVALEPLSAEGAESVRERLLVASARASRLLLEAADVHSALPLVLEVLGRAANVDRVTMMEVRTGPSGEPLLAVSLEWAAESGVTRSGAEQTRTCDERKIGKVCEALRAGRTVCFTKDPSSANGALEAIEGEGTRTKAIVPIFVAAEFIGLVGFDNTRHERAIEASELAALETAAGVIGAALHRDRLIDDVRRERQRAAEEQAKELARANAVLRSNLERLAGETELHSFMGHILLEATRQFDAFSGAVIVRKEKLHQWRVVTHVLHGQACEPPYAVSVPDQGSAFSERFGELRLPEYIPLERQRPERWPGSLAFDQREGTQGTLLYPLVFGQSNVGFLMLNFRRDAREVLRSELLVALAQQAALAVQLTRLAYSTKESAVLMERARIGQEIHDGLAQAFTGILLQLGSIEENRSCRRGDSTLVQTLERVKALARDGLADARRSVMALRVDRAAQGGLEASLRQLADRSTVPGGVTCTFDGSGRESGLRPEQEHELLRIAQEAVSNALRHAGARVIRISMLDGEGAWTLAVSDDGVGLRDRPERLEKQGFGLASMRQRATAIGAHWDVDSSGGRGTRISVRWAMPQG